MGTDLHAPLGRDRDTNRKKRRRLSSSVFLGAFGAIVVIGLSIYSFQAPENLKSHPLSAGSDPASLSPSSATSQGAAVSARETDGLQRVHSQSGARVEQTTTTDGNVVTKYTPQPRGGDGPVLINTGRYGQDPRMAAFPNEDLLEDSPHGRLPIIGADGLRPMDQYARPWSGARGTRVAIVVGGLGLSQTGTQRAIKSLPPEITFAFAASGNSLQRWMQEARRAGHEILLQVPLEPFGHADNDAGPGTLLVKDGAQANLEKLHKTMARITNYTGIMNYQGGRFLSDAAALEPVMRDIGERGLLFLDDGTSARSQTEVLAKAFSTPFAFADLQLDGQLQVNAILGKLDELERIARRNGTAIAVASAFDESVTAIRQWSEEASRRGIEIVGVSALVSDPQNP